MPETGYLKRKTLDASWVSKKSPENMPALRGGQRGRSFVIRHRPVWEQLGGCGRSLERTKLYLKTATFAAKMRRLAAAVDDEMQHASLIVIAAGYDRLAQKYFNIEREATQK